MNRTKKKKLLQQKVVGKLFTFENIFQKLSPKKFKNRLQFYMEIFCKFSKNHKFETIFEKSHRVSVILKIVGATLQLVQNLTPLLKEIPFNLPLETHF